ncbi:MAG: B12-binding domain-containing radical SAM protein [Gemmatimonadetes bacterium]|nr:B12-binding domain-containing radical SAM protein [Gemmatimonadota bacterium]
MEAAGTAASGLTLRRTTRKGLLLVPEFPSDSFWSYRYVMRLIGRKAAFPPLGVLTFAGYMPDDWDLELVDLNVRAPSAGALRAKLADADAVFVSAMSIQKRSLVDVLRGPARDLDVPFVLGGPFASSYRDQILDPQSESDRILHDGLDALVWGEAYASVDELLSWLAERPVHDAGTPRLFIPEAVACVDPGSRAYLNDRSIFRSLDEVPLPRWDLMRVTDYHSMMIQTTAGCPFRCDFCDIIQFNGGFNRPKAPAAVTRELEALLATGYRGSVFSVDDNFIGTPAATSEILDAIIEFQREHGYPFSFYTQASVNLGTPKLQHLIGKMKQAGFDAVFLGIENPDEDALRGMNKKQNIKVDVPETIAAIQAAGIEVYAGFIFGSDSDVPGTADRIVEFVKRTRIFTAMTGMLTPVPHTPLWERLKSEGRLQPAEYSGNNTDDAVQFVPLRMTAEQMYQGIHDILSRLFNPAESYRRAMDMLHSVQPHIFSGRRMELRYLKSALLSFWKQGLRRFDRAYFRFLWQAGRLDRRVRRRARSDARQLKRLLRRLHRDGVVRVQGDLARMEQLVGEAHDYLVRFRPDARLDQVREWAAGVRARASMGSLSVDDARVLYENARRYLKVQMRLHRFPGVALSRAVEAAIKGLHYERVMNAVVEGEGRG